MSLILNAYQVTVPCSAAASSRPALRKAASCSPGRDRGPDWNRLQTADYGAVLAAPAVAAVFSGRIPLPGRVIWPGPVRLPEGDLYMPCDLAMLAGTALVLIRERAHGWPELSLPAAAAGSIAGPPESAGVVPGTRSMA